MTTRRLKEPAGLLWCRAVRGTLLGMWRHACVERTAWSGNAGVEQGGRHGGEETPGHEQPPSREQPHQQPWGAVPSALAGPVYRTRTACQRKTSTKPTHQLFCSHPASTGNNPYLLTRSVLPP